MKFINDLSDEELKQELLDNWGLIDDPDKKVLESMGIFPENHTHEIKKKEEKPLTNA